MPKPAPREKKVHRLEMTAGGERTPDHVHVTGHMEIEHEGAKLQVPIRYRVRHDEDPARHEEILDEIQAKAKHWASKRVEHCAMEGTKQNVAGCEIHITDCDLQMHSANDWKLVCSWNETHPGGPTTRHHKIVSYRTPLQAMSSADLMAIVHGEASARATAHSNMSAHKEAFRAVNLTHSTEVARLRRARDLRDGGPEVRPGDGVPVVGDVPKDPHGKQ